MYQYTEFDRQFVRLRAAQYRDQLERWQARHAERRRVPPLRLQNGWYMQRYAPMLRMAVPYGELSSAQLRMLATSPATTTARRPTAGHAQATQDAGPQPGLTWPPLP
jgi:sulfite reductase (NADPH) hemoprotein beta-component